MCDRSVIQQQLSSVLTSIASSDNIRSLALAFDEVTRLLIKLKKLPG